MTDIQLVEKTVCEMFDELPIMNSVEFISVDRVQDMISEPCQLSFETVDELLEELDYSLINRTKEYCD